MAGPGPGDIVVDMNLLSARHGDTLSLSIRGNMTLHTRPIQTQQSIPGLQQGNLGNTQGILTAVTQ